MPEQSSHPWRIIWQYASSDGFLAVLLLAIACGLTLTVWIPQQPSSDADYARWLSQVQARFGETMPMMRALGLYGITHTPGFRVLLAVLSGCLLVRLVENADGFLRGQQVVSPRGDWKKVSARRLAGLLEELRARRYRLVSQSSFVQVDRWPWANLLPPVTHVGALLLLAGLLLSHLWGWQVEGLVLQNGQRLSLPGAANWVELSADGRPGHSPGVVTFVEKRGPGVHVSVSQAGRSLRLQLTPEAEPSTELMMALIEDRYFAIPDAELIARLTPRSQQAYSLVDVQVYRSPPGQMVAEMATDEGGEAELTVEDVTMIFTAAPYVRVTAAANPGRWPAALALVLLMVGLVGHVGWPAHRFWVRADEDTIEATGATPSWLLGGEKGY